MARRGLGLYFIALHQLNVKWNNSRSLTADQGLHPASAGSLFSSPLPRLAAPPATPAAAPAGAAPGGRGATHCSLGAVQSRDQWPFRPHLKHSASAAGRGCEIHRSRGTVQALPQCPVWPHLKHPACCRPAAALVIAADQRADGGAITDLRTFSRLPKGTQYRLLYFAAGPQSLCNGRQVPNVAALLCACVLLNRGPR